MKQEKQNKIDAAHLTASAENFEMNSEADDPTSRPVSMLARSSQPIEHPYWGVIAHDIDGVVHKQSIPIDYAHNDNEVIGYLDSLTATPDGLQATGRLVSFTPEDRAAEVIFKSEKGVPYEASINFAGEPLELENVTEGQTASVNGYELTGPAVIVRKWTCRGVAVAPYGADQGTSTALLSNKPQITAKWSNNPMAEEKKFDHEEGHDGPLEPVDGVCPDGYEVSEDGTACVAVAEAPADEAPAESETEQKADAVEMTADAETVELDEVRRFTEAFGQRGVEMLLAGQTFEEAKADHYELMSQQNAELKTENERLRGRLEQIAKLNGEASDDALDFSPAPEAAKTGRAGLASLIKLPNRN